jgi:hypothetical protein
VVVPAVVARAALEPVALVQGAVERVVLERQAQEAPAVQSAAGEAARWEERPERRWEVAGAWEQANFKAGPAATSAVLWDPRARPKAALKVRWDRTVCEGKLAVRPADN